jgi:hypothetical protein
MTDERWSTGERSLVDGQNNVTGSVEIFACVGVIGDLYSGVQR